jgi:hypothetical protein
MQAKYASSKIMKDFLERQKVYDINNKIRNEEINCRIDKERNYRVAEMKFKSEHVKEVLQKYHQAMARKLQLQMEKIKDN